MPDQSHVRIGEAMTRCETSSTGVLRRFRAFAACGFVVAAALLATTGASAAVDTVPALAELVGPRAAEMHAAGVRSIGARIGKGRRDIQVETQYGYAYFAWPKNVTPIEFAIYPKVGATVYVSVYAADYTEADKARYAAAFDAIIPEAIRQAGVARAATQRPRR
jgi:UDP-N-acetylglucosamine enolpyruvyl transferase